MDQNTTAILAIIGIVISVGSSVLAAINHQRVRSNCCGQKLEVSLDVERTTPPSDKLEIKSPANNSVV